jgi:microcystin-dependent protein
MLKKVKQILGLTQNDPTIGSIELWAGHMIPRCFAPCQGQKMTIKGNEALFSVIGTTYGGDGINNFALPDYRPRDAKGNPVSWDKADTPMVLICIYGIYPSWAY